MPYLPSDRTKVNSGCRIPLKMLAMSSFKQNIYLEGPQAGSLWLTSLPNAPPFKLWRGGGQGEITQGFSLNDKFI